MNKKIILISILLIGLVGCGQKQNNVSIENKGKENINSSKTSNIDTNVKNNNIPKIVNEENKIFLESSQNIEKKNPKIIKIYNVYNDKVTKISNILGTDEIETIKILNTYYPYIEKYKTLPENLKEKKEYEKFIIENMKKNGLIDFNEKKLNKLIDNSKEIEYVYKAQAYLKDYLLPDGSIVDKNLKQQFDDFVQNGGYQDSATALEEFKRQVVTENLTMEGKCDEIPNEIDRAYCKEIKR